MCILTHLTLNLKKKNNCYHFYFLIKPKPYLMIPGYIKQNKDPKT